MPDIVFPITCPECKQESLNSLPAEKIKRALLASEPLMLRSGCHKVIWQATAREAEQIKEYLWAMHLER
jgi:hypothetical protein